jgi:hypothetical protein
MLCLPLCPYAQWKEKGCDTKVVGWEQSDCLNGGATSSASKKLQAMMQAAKCRAFKIVHQLMQQPDLETNLSAAELAEWKVLVAADGGTGLCPEGTSGTTPGSCCLPLKYTAPVMYEYSGQGFQGGNGGKTPCFQLAKDAAPSPFSDWGLLTKEQQKKWQASSCNKMGQMVEAYCKQVWKELMDQPQLDPNKFPEECRGYAQLHLNDRCQGILGRHYMQHGCSANVITKRAMGLTSDMGGGMGEAAAAAAKGAAVAALRGAGGVAAAAGAVLAKKLEAELLSNNCAKGQAGVDAAFPTTYARPDCAVSGMRDPACFDLSRCSIEGAEGATKGRITVYIYGKPRDRVYGQYQEPLEVSRMTTLPCCARSALHLLLCAICAAPSAVRVCASVHRASASVCVCAHMPPAYPSLCLTSCISFALPNFLHILRFA